jgi:P27 family predicted phage terminase small subunit
MLLVSRKAQRQARPPAHLSEAMRKFWRTTVRDFELSDHHLHLLESACSAWDRAELARQTVREHGLTFVDDHGNVKAHPAVNIETASRRLFAASLRELGLDVKSADVPRAPYLPAYQNNAQKREVG